MAWKTTKADFELFKHECLRWIEIYGLKGWEFFFFHNDNEPEYRASFVADQIGRCVSITLTITWKVIKPNRRLIKKCAFHEVTEVLLCRLRTMARDRDAEEHEISEECHNLIRILEKVLFDET